MRLSPRIEFVLVGATVDYAGCHIPSARLTLCDQGERSSWDASLVPVPGRAWRLDQPTWSLTLPPTAPAAVCETLMSRTGARGPQGLRMFVRHPRGWLRLYGVTQTFETMPLLRTSVVSLYYAGHYLELLGDMFLPVNPTQRREKRATFVM